LYPPLHSACAPVQTKDEKNAFDREPRTYLSLSHEGLFFFNSKDKNESHVYEGGFLFFREYVFPFSSADTSRILNRPALLCFPSG
jgi:hypothetical protein